MEAMVWSKVTYRQASLPKLRIAQESCRRDSLSSSRTGDSGYNSDPDISLSPLDFVSPDQIPCTSSDFTWDSSALLEVKEVASSRTKRLTTGVCDPIATKKCKFAQETASILPRIEVTSNPSLTKDTASLQRSDWIVASNRPISEVNLRQHLATTSRQAKDIEPCLKPDFRPEETPKQRNLSIISLSSTGSCDMYSNADDNSGDEEDALNHLPSTLSKATLTTIELIMRKIEVNLGYAAYMQCAGTYGSRAQGAPNASRSSRGNSQASSSKRKSRSDESLPPDEPDEDGSNKRRRISIATTTEDSETGPRFACPFFKHDPNRYRNRRTCPGPGWPTVHRVKEHLYRSHAQPIYCPRCFAIFDLDSDFAAHIRGNPCQTSAPQPIEGIDRKTFESLKKRSPALRLEEDKWRDTYQLLFPEVSPTDIPSPYYDSDSPSEESRRFRRELLERIRQELFAMADREPGPVEQRLLRQVAAIIRRCENDLLSSFNLPPGNAPSSQPTSRRTSAVTMNVDDGLRPQARQLLMHAPAPEHIASVPPPGLASEPTSPRTNALLAGTAQGGQGWNDILPFPSDWIDWNAVFPPGLEGPDSAPTLSAPVWTR